MGDGELPDRSTVTSGVDVDRICQVLADLAPLGLAESWDNVGLLVGDRRRSVRRVMTCLTVTPAVVSEAIARQCDLVIAHHPLPFKPLNRITSDSTPGRMLLALIGAGIAVYSAHTAFDSAAEGINQQWADRLGLREVRPLLPPTAEGATACEETTAGNVATVGGGRWGLLATPLPLEQLAARAAACCGAEEYRVVGSDPLVTRVGIGCGSGGGFLAAAKARGCQVLITGEATFHTCLEAQANGIGLVLVGHYASERFAMEQLVDRLGPTLRKLDRELEVCVSVAESNPLRTVSVTPAED